jgi:hypothetical protein
MRNQYLEDAYVRLNQVEQSLISENVSRSSLENQLQGIQVLLLQSQSEKKQVAIDQAIELIENAITMARVLSDLRGIGPLGKLGQFPAPFSPFVAPSVPNFSYSPFVYAQTSALWPKMTKPSQPRLYQILTLVRQAKNLVLQMIRYTPV